MTDERLFIGVDGGNTKAVALAARADGSIVGAARELGCSDIYAVPVDEAVERLLRVTDDALAQAAGRNAGVAGVGFSLAGADWPEDIALLETRLRGRWPAAVVVNDAIGALRAAIPTGPGVVVVCGTGATTGARGPDGRTWHASFWQLPQGAHELGVFALHAVYRAALGIDPPTLLTESLLAATGEPDVEAILHRTTRRERRDGRLAATLAHVLLDAAEEGDPTALDLVRTHGTALGRTALAAARRVGIENDRYTLALAGGVLRHAGTVLRETIVATVRADAPRVAVAGSRLEPAAGAVLLAYDAAGVAVAQAVEDRLHETMPAIFDTHPATATPG
jgi:N-acetylglucosamine kinase-like BadF-type ATPase